VEGKPIYYVHLKHEQEIGDGKLAMIPPTNYRLQIVLTRMRLQLQKCWTIASATRFPSVALVPEASG
jgi:hypothetical protein